MMRDDASNFLPLPIVLCHCHEEKHMYEIDKRSKPDLYTFSSSSIAVEISYSLICMKA